MITKILPPTKESLDYASKLIKKGELVAFPTETVYGLGASIWDEEGIRKIFTAKGRPADNPLIAHIAEISQAYEIAEFLPPLCLKLFSLFFPGPLTVVVPKHNKVPSIVSGDLDTIAFRMPSHPIALELIRFVGAPIVAPSANLSGKPSPVNAAHVYDDLNGKIPLILDGGETSFGIESTVISLCDPQNPMLLRLGSITKEEIEEKLGIKLQLPAKGSHVHSPGMKYRHYAPKAPLFIFTSKGDLEKHLSTRKFLKRLLISNEEGDLPLKASSLYSSLREGDKRNCDEICVLLDEKAACDLALLDRLKKASCEN